jgi:hypothetical protein
MKEELMLYLLVIEQQHFHLKRKDIKMMALQIPKKNNNTSLKNIFFCAERMFSKRLA